MKMELVFQVSSHERPLPIVEAALALLPFGAVQPPAARDAGHGSCSVPEAQICGAGGATMRLTRDYTCAGSRMEWRTYAHP